MEPDQEHFESIPWCRILLQDPAFRINPFYSRALKPDHEDSLLAETLNSPDTVSHIISTYRVPLPVPALPAPSSSSASSSLSTPSSTIQPPSPPPPPFITEVRCLLTLGSGLNGGPNLLHGGIISALMDDVVGILMTINQDYSSSSSSSSPVSAPAPLSANTVTAWMKTIYERPVRTPQTLVVGAVCRRREGRKFWVDAEVKDGDGVRLASSESLWVQLKEDSRKRKEKL